MIVLDDEEIIVFDLGYDLSEDGVNERVEGGVVDKVVCDMDEEVFVG